MGISYYYYEDDFDLKKKLKSTCFTIARDIVLNNFDHHQSSPLLIRKLAIEHDINIGFKYCQMMDATLEINGKTQFSFINSNLMIQTFDIHVHEILTGSKSLFTDRKYCELLRRLC